MALKSAPHFTRRRQTLTRALAISTTALFLVTAPVAVSMAQPAESPGNGAPAQAESCDPVTSTTTTTTTVATTTPTSTPTATSVPCASATGDKPASSSPSVPAQKTPAATTAPTTTSTPSSETAPTSSAPQQKAPVGEWAPTENPKATVIPGQMRSDREEIPEPFTKADADKAETMEARISTARLTAGCQVYWPSPFEVCGAIRDKYNSLGGPGSFLSFPTTAELTNPNNSGKRTQFLNGPIYWSVAGGAHPVVNSFLNRWGVHQYEAGWLKYPISDEILLPDGGRRQEFETGAIYVAVQNAIGSAIRNGPLRDKWNAVGAQTAGSLLGYPVQDQILLPDGQGQMDRFQRGVIYWHPTTGAHPVTEPVLGQWASSGYEGSTFGYPLEDAVAEPGNSVRQKFQNGSIYTPGNRVPIGGGLSLTYGVPTTNILQASVLPDGISYTGPGYSLALRFGPYATVSIAELEIQNSQAPTEFRFVFGLPGGYSLRSTSTSVEVVNSVGAVVGDIQSPVASDANHGNIVTQTSVVGNQVSYQFAAGAKPMPITAIGMVSNDTTDQYNPYYRIGPETTKVCNLERFDCGRSIRAYFDSQKWSVTHYPSHVDSNGTPIYFNERLDADRHCMWQAMTTEASNAEFAGRLGDAHEEDGRAGAPPGAEEMDRYNNITGRAVGLRNEGNVSGIITTCKGYADVVRITTPDQFGTNTASTANDLVALNGP